MAKQSHTDESSTVPMPFAFEKIRDAVDEIDATRFVNIDELVVRKGEDDNIFVDIVTDQPADELFDLENIKRKIINTVMRTDPDVSLAKLCASHTFMRFEVEQ
jgi:hypothetical protein